MLWWFSPLGAARIVFFFFFFHVLRVGSLLIFYFVSLKFSKKGTRAFCGDVSKGSEVFGGLRRGRAEGGKREIFVCARCFSSLPHNGAFREPLLKGIATAFV